MSYNTEITEDFASASTPPTGWTERNGSWTVAGGIITPDDGTGNRAITHDTALSHLNHWAKVQYAVYTAASYDGVILRSPNATYGPRYMIRVPEGTGYVEFRVCGDGSSSHG